MCLWLTWANLLVQRTTTMETTTKFPMMTRRRKKIICPPRRQRWVGRLGRVFIVYIPHDILAKSVTLATIGNLITFSSVFS